MRRGKRKREKWVPHVLNLLGDNGWEEKGTRASCQKRAILSLWATSIILLESPHHYNYFNTQGPNQVAVSLLSLSYSV